jgi:predicted secreted protein
MADSFAVSIDAPGQWQELLAGAGKWLVTGNDNYAWSAASPAEAIPGHFRLARQDLVVVVLEGEKLWVRALRPMRLTVTADA